MYVVNIDDLPVSATFKVKLAPFFKVLEITEADKVPCNQIVGIYCRFSRKIDANFINNYKNLRFIACNATGIDHIDENACKEKNVKIYSLRDAVNFLTENVTSSSEHTWCLVLAAARKIKHHQNRINNKIFDRNKNIGLQLKNKKIGLIGLGRNGLQVAKYATAFDMNVAYYDPYVNDKKYIKFHSLKKLFTESNIIVISCKLNDETKDMIDERILNAGNSVILVNTSRGEIVREDHVLDALDKSYLSAYATDVLRDERNALNSAIFYRSLSDENVILTPHIGGATMDAWELTEGYLADDILKYEVQS